MSETELPMHEPWAMHHNPETGYIGICPVGHEDEPGGTICEVGNDFPSTEQELAYARRIVACVNACAGIPTENLSKYAAQIESLHAKMDRMMRRSDKFSSEIAEVEAELKAESGEPDEDTDDSCKIIDGKRYPIIRVTQSVIEAGSVGQLANPVAIALNEVMGGRWIVKQEPYWKGGTPAPVFAKEWQSENDYTDLGYPPAAFLKAYYADSRQAEPFSFLYPHPVLQVAQTTG